MELLTMTFAREMRQHWPDMPGREIFTRTTQLVQDVRKRIADIRAVGGAYMGPHNRAAGDLNSGWIHRWALPA